MDKLKKIMEAAVRSILEEKSLSPEQEIEEILEEANAYNLRSEVKETAEKILLKENKDTNVISKLSAYVIAYHEWIK